MDPDIIAKSFFFTTESLEQLLGRHGAQAVLRSAGQRAAGSLIDMLPLSLAEQEAAQRSGEILKELGFVSDMEFTPPGCLRIDGNRFQMELETLGLGSSGSGRYFVIGLFEGFFKQLSGSSRKVRAPRSDDGCEYWELG